MADNRWFEKQSFFGRMFNSIREIREQRKEERLLQSLPKEYAAFVERYVPDSTANEALFNKIKHILSQNPVNIKTFSEEFAKIGDAYLLQHLWAETPVNEPDTRKIIIENPNCPKDIILEAIGDPFPDVAATAIANPAVTESDCLEAVYHIDRTSPGTVKALERRLEEFGYRVDWSPWETHGSLRYRNEPMIYRIANVISPRQDKVVPEKKKTSLDEQISDAKKRSEAQAKSQDRSLYRSSNSRIEFGL